MSQTLASHAQPRAAATGGQVITGGAFLQHTHHKAKGNRLQIARSLVRFTYQKYGYPKSRPILAPPTRLRRPQRQPCYLSLLGRKVARQHQRQTRWGRQLNLRDTLTIWMRRFTFSASASNVEPVALMSFPARAFSERELCAYTTGSCSNNHVKYRLFARLT